MRNNLVAAIQNMEATKMYIAISLPYCDGEELQTLRDAATYISLDTQSQVSISSELQSRNSNKNDKYSTLQNY